MAKENMPIKNWYQKLLTSSVSIISSIVMFVARLIHASVLGDIESNI